jgi:hypothetical protein
VVYYCYHKDYKMTAFFSNQFQVLQFRPNYQNQ